MAEKIVATLDEPVLLFPLRLEIRRVSLPTPVAAHNFTSFGGGVFLIDTGMLSSFYPGGRASALEIQGDEVTAIYPGQRQPLP